MVIVHKLIKFGIVDNIKVCVNFTDKSKLIAQP